MPFTVGQKVRCRDSDDEPWNIGTVVEVLAGIRPKVKVEGHARGLTWEQVQQVADSRASPAIPLRDPALGSSPPPGPGRDPAAAERHGITEEQICALLSRTSALLSRTADSPERWAGGAAGAARGVPRAGERHRHGAGSRYSALYSQSPVDPNVQWLYHDGTTLRPFNDYFNNRLEEAYKQVKGGHRAGGYGLMAAEVYVTIGREHYYADVEKMSARRGADFRGRDQPVMLRRVDLRSLGMDDSPPPAEFRSAAEGSDAVQYRALGGGTQPGDVSPQRRSGSTGSERSAAGSPPARGGPHTPPPESPRAVRDPAHSAAPGDATEHHGSGEMADRPPSPPRGPESPLGQVQPPPAEGSDAGSGRQRAHQTPQAAGAAPPVLSPLSRSASAGALPRGLDSHALAGGYAPAVRRVQSSDTLESLPPTVPVRLEPVAPRPGARSASRTAWDEAAPEDSEPRFPEVLEVIVKHSFQGYTGRYVRAGHTRNGAPVWQQQGSDKVLDFSKLQGDTYKRWTLGSPMGCHIKSEQMPSPTCGPQAARGWVACKSLQEAAVQVHVFDPLQEFDQGLPLYVAPVLPQEPSLEDILTTRALSWAERRSAPTEVFPSAPDFRAEATLLQRAEGDARAMLRAREHRGWLVGVGAFREVLTCSRMEEYERQSIRRSEASQRVHFTMTLRYHFLRGLEQRRRWAIASTCLVHSVQLEQALHFGQLWYNAAALIAYWRATNGTLRHMLPEQLRSAALARARCIRVALPDRGAGCVSYQRSFTLHEDMPQWTCTKDGKRFAILFRTVKSNGFEMLDHKGQVLAGAAETCTMLDHGCVECNGPDGRRLMISIAPGQGEAETLPLYSQWAEPFRMVQNMPTQFQPIASGSEVDDARKAAWKRRVILDDAQEAARASGPQHRARAERDSARVAALAAQKHFVKALNAPEVEALLRDGKGALASLEKAFLDAGSPAVACGDRPAATEAIGLAADQAKQLLDSFQTWQRKYEDAVKAAEAGTDAARAAAQRFTLDPENPTACPSLEKLADFIREAAEAEAALRASPEGVTPAPREQMDAAVAAALVAIDGGLGVLLALDTERREAQSVLNELSEGCRAAEGGEFYARLQRMVAPDAESMLSPRQVSGGKGARQKYELLLTMRSSFLGAEAKWEAECAKLCREAEEEEARAVPLATLHEEADLLLARQKHAKTPADKAKNQQRLDAVLQQLRRLRKERMAEAAEVLRLASIHFPECTNELCRGTDEELRRMMLDKRPESLRLLVAGGSLTDYTICGPSLSRRQPVIPADSGHGRVVIKKTPLTEGALQTFGRGVVMMDAAGDAAAAVRCVFVDVHEDTPHGCVVMENYEFTLATWAAPERAEALSPAAILRMVQLLLGCLVRLHSSTPRLRDAELADGIIHGDISPANIVVDEWGQPRFIDFEMARTGGVQASTVFGPQGMTVEFAAPELLSRYGMRDPSVKATKMTDVYGMGATLKHVLEQPHVRRVAGRVCEHLIPLCERMQSRDPGARPTAAEAFAASDITEAIDQQFRLAQGELDEQHRKVTAERDRVLREQAAVQAEKQDVAELAKKLASKAASLKDKGEAEREANEREQERLRRREAELKDKGAKLAAEEKALSAEHKKVETQKRQIEKLKEAVHDPPKHWTDAPGLSQGWRAAPVADTTPVFLALKNSLLKTKKEWLGFGRDAGGGKYDKLVLQRAWRIENPNQWKQYSIAREVVADAVKHKRLGKKDLKLRQETADTLGPKGTALPDALRGGGVNEVRLFHGTGPDVLLSLLNDGLNERFSGTNAGAVFGQGVYFAEDPGKSDHYVRPHAPGTAPDLERRLYRAGVTQPGTVFYVLVCRVVCGDFAVTVDAETLTTGGTLWATPHKRELVRTPTGDHYTSLLAELGSKITRYREFILFRGQRAYPEYLLAYTRE